MKETTVAHSYICQPTKFRKNPTHILKTQIEIPFLSFCMIYLVVEVLDLFCFFFFFFNFDILCLMFAMLRYLFIETSYPVHFKNRWNSLLEIVF